MTNTMHTKTGSTSTFLFKNPLLIGLLSSIAIVLICLLSHRQFFFIDDAQNEYLPFYKEMGRIWLSSNIPLITTNTMLGGNFIVDMVLTPFTPQTIVTSIIAASTNSTTFPSVIFAFSNIYIAFISAYYIAKSYKIDIAYSYAAAFAISTSPIFLHIFTATWWNQSIAYSWFLAAFAALLHLKNKITITSFATCLVSSFFLFLSAGIQIQLIYIIYTLYLAFNAYNCKNTRFTILCFIILAIVFLTATVPFMGEYYVSGSQIDRYSAYENVNNFLVPTLNQVANVANPFSGGYMSWYGGYRYVSLPIAYSVILFMPVLCFFVTDKNDKKSINEILSLGLIALVLSLTSSQFGPLRYPFRFLSIFNIIATMLTFYILSSGRIIKSNIRKKVYFSLVTISATMGFFSVEDKIFTRHNVALTTAYLITSAIIYLILTSKINFKQKKTGLILMVLLGWLAVLVGTRSLAGKYLSFPGTPESISKIEKNKGYVLGLCGSANNGDKNITDLFSAQFLLYDDTKSINGYSPVGHKGFGKYFQAPGPHGIFDQEKTLTMLINGSSIDKNIRNYQIFGISTIVACQNTISTELKNSLLTSGFEIRKTSNDEKYLIEAIKYKEPEGTITYQSGVDSIKFVRQSGYNHEWYSVRPSNLDKTIIFNRIFWKGYNATLNGSPLQVKDYDNTLIKITIPKNSGGELHVWYSPSSWKYTRWSLLFGLIIAVATIVQIQRSIITKLSSTNRTGPAAN